MSLKVEVMCFFSNDLKKKNLTVELKKDNHKSQNQTEIVFQTGKTVLESFLSSLHTCFVFLTDI